MSSISPTFKTHEDKLKESHDELKDPSSINASSDPSNSILIANSLDLSSDDDLLDKQLSSLTGASSTTTTTSSSFLDNKRMSSFDVTLPGVVEQLKTSDGSLNKIEAQIDAAVNETAMMRYRVEQQRKNSIPLISNQAKSEAKVY